MSSSSILKAYYLQQMGIQTWVRRSVPTRVSNLHLIAPQQGDVLALVLFEGGDLDNTDSWIDGAAGRLLKQMLQSIGLSPDNTAVVLGVSSMRDDVVQAHVTRLAPRIVLVFALNPVVVAFQNTPMINSVHPTLLLTQPFRKKSAYLDLLRVKALLYSEQAVMS